MQGSLDRMIIIIQMFFLCSMSDEPAQVDKDSSSKRQVILEWFVLHSAVEIRTLKEKVILRQRLKKARTPYSFSIDDNILERTKDV